MYGKHAIKPLLPLFQRHNQFVEHHRTLKLHGKKGIRHLVFLFLLHRSAGQNQQINIRLRTFAVRLGHPAATCLQSPFVHYVATNLPNNARTIFFGLREAKPDLVGIAIFDRLETSLQSANGLTELMWQRRELENYLCSEDVLMAYASGTEEKNLFTASQEPKRREAMSAAIEKTAAALAALDKPGPWSVDIKVTDEFLDPLFKSYFQKLRLPITFRKADYHQLARFVARERIDPEIKQKLDAICATANKAKPRK